MTNEIEARASKAPAARERPGAGPQAESLPHLRDGAARECAGIERGRDPDLQAADRGRRAGEDCRSGAEEELSTLLEDTLATPHEKIRIFSGNGLPGKAMAPDFNPSGHELRRVVGSAGARQAVAAGV